MLVRTAAGLSVFCLEVLTVVETAESLEILSHDENDVSAGPAVAAVGTAFLDVLFSAK
jgi:hypothetical protein